MFLLLLVLLISVFSFCSCASERAHYFTVDVCQHGRRSELEEVVTIHADASACVSIYENKLLLKHGGSGDHIEVCSNCEKSKCVQVEMGKCKVYHDLELYVDTVEMKRNMSAPSLDVFAVPKAADCVKSVKENSPVATVSVAECSSLDDDSALLLDGIDTVNEVAALCIFPAPKIGIDNCKAFLKQRTDKAACYVVSYTELACELRNPEIRFQLRVSDKSWIEEEVGAVLAGVFVIICGCLTLVLICYCRMVRRRRALASGFSTNNATFDEEDEEEGFGGFGAQSNRRGNGFEPDADVPAVYLEK